MPQTAREIKNKKFLSRVVVRDSGPELGRPAGRPPRNQTTSRLRPRPPPPPPARALHRSSYKSPPPPRPCQQQPCAVRVNLSSPSLPGISRAPSGIRRRRSEGQRHGHGGGRGGRWRRADRVAGSGAVWRGGVGVEEGKFKYVLL